MPSGRTVSIVDSTLRDGIQTPGVELGLDDRIKIAEAVAMAGVNELEAGIPSASELDAQAVAKIASLGLPCRITAWCRADLGDIQAAERSKVPSVHISFPASEILLDAFGKTRDWVLRNVEELIPKARERFGFVSVGLQDVARTDFDFLSKLAKLVWEAGAGRLRLADSCGVWNPFQSFDCFQRLSEALPDLPLAMHAHNDLGMGTANALGAVFGGATTIDSTVNGLGERSGNPPLAEIAMAFELSGVSTTLRTESMLPLSKLVAKLTGRAVASDKPVVGRACFMHHSGLHVRALLKNPMAYQPFMPEKIGRPEPFSIFIGQQSGRASVDYALKKLKLPTDSETLDGAVKKLKSGKGSSPLNGRVVEYE